MGWCYSVSVFLDVSSAITVHSTGLTENVFYVNIHGLWHRRRLSHFQQVISRSSTYFLYVSHTGVCHFRPLRVMLYIFLGPKNISRGDGSTMYAEYFLRRQLIRCPIKINLRMYLAETVRIWSYYEYYFSYFSSV